MIVCKKNRDTPEVSRRDKLATLKKWLVRYWIWTWPVLGLLILLVGYSIYLIATVGVGAFSFWLTLALAFIGIYRTVKGQFPPTWLMITIICIPIGMWGLYVLKPSWYTEWRGSRFFIWTLVAILSLAWLSNYKNHSVAIVARKSILAILTLLIIAGILYKVPEMIEDTKEITEPITKVVGIDSAAPHYSEEAECVVLKRKAQFMVINTAPGKWTAWYCLPSRMTRASWDVKDGLANYITETDNGAYTYSPTHADEVPEGKKFTRVRFLATGERVEPIELRLEP